MSHRVGIIGGAGVLGSTTAFLLAMRGLIDEVVLIDVRKNLLSAHVMDMEQAVSTVSRTSVSAGSYESLAGCDVVIVCASAESNANDRMRFLDSNLPIVESIARHIVDRCPQAVVINATNPVDVLNYALMCFTGLPRSQFIGFSYNDSIRFRLALADVLRAPPGRVGGLVIGEHGRCQVPLFSTVTIDARPVVLDEVQCSEIQRRIDSWFGVYTKLNSGRTSGWTSAVSVVDVVENVLRNGPRTLALSVIPGGEYGLSGLSVGLPVMLGSQGVASIVELTLSTGEADGLNAAAEKLARVLRDSLGRLRMA